MPRKPNPQQQGAASQQGCWRPCFVLGNIGHSTSRVVRPCGTTHLAFLSLSSTSLTALSPESDLTVTHRVQETREVLISKVLTCKCFICLPLDIQIRHCSPFLISVFFLLPQWWSHSCARDDVTPLQPTPRHPCEECSFSSCVSGGS